MQRVKEYVMTQQELKKLIRKYDLFDRIVAPLLNWIEGKSNR